MPAPLALQELRRLAPYLGYRAASTVARTLPPPVACALTSSLAAVVSAAARNGSLPATGLRERRAMVERHLQRVRGPGLSGAKLDRAVQQAFASYGRYWVESFRLPGTPPAELDARMSYEGLAHLDRSLAAGNGVIMALPHLGGWDYGGAWFASQGYRPTVVVEPLDPPELFEWFATFRERLGVRVVPLGPEAGTATLRVLREGGIVGLLCDRDIGRTGVEVDFFGERTTLPSGPATLALRTGAALLPTAVYFRGARDHHGVVRPPVALERTGRFREDVRAVTARLAREFEGLIRVAPEQWHLFQPNWPSDHEFLADLRLRRRAG